jgi:hypothetical protein
MLKRDAQAHPKSLCNDLWVFTKSTSQVERPGLPSRRFEEFESDFASIEGTTKLKPELSRLNARDLAGESPIVAHWLEVMWDLG